MRASFVRSLFHIEAEILRNCHPSPFFCQRLLYCPFSSFSITLFTIPASLTRKTLPTDGVGDSVFMSVYGYDYMHRLVVNGICMIVLDL
jgi:hypothetical protein